MKNQINFNIKFSLKLITMFIATLLILTSATSFATAINGNSNLLNTKFPNLTINGSLEFQNLQIENLLKVNGSINERQLTCEIYPFHFSFR